MYFIHLDIKLTFSRKKCLANEGVVTLLVYVVSLKYTSEPDCMGLRFEDLI